MARLPAELNADMKYQRTIHFHAIKTETQVIEFKWYLPSSTSPPIQEAAGKLGFLLEQNL